MKADEMFELTGRVALVTGASSGLGQQFARALADNGAAVALVARRADRLEAFRAELEKTGAKNTAIPADVNSRDDMIRAFDEAEKAFGTVTILVNNAGVAQQSVRATEVTPEEWQVRVDLAACYRLVNHYGWDEMIANHISVRVPGEEGTFLLNP